MSVIAALRILTKQLAGDGAIARHRAAEVEAELNMAINDLKKARDQSRDGRQVASGVMRALCDIPLPEGTRRTSGEMFSPADTVLKGDLAEIEARVAAAANVPTKKVDDLLCRLSSKANDMRREAEEAQRIIRDVRAAHAASHVAAVRAAAEIAEANETPVPAGYSYPELIDKLSKEESVSRELRKELADVRRQYIAANDEVASLLSSVNSMAEERTRNETILLSLNGRIATLTTNAEKANANSAAIANDYNSIFLLLHRMLNSRPDDMPTVVQDARSFMAQKREHVGVLHSVGLITPAPSPKKEGV